MQFLCQVGPGDRPELAINPDAWTDEDNRVAAEHYERLRQATGEGKVLSAGSEHRRPGPCRRHI